jgi:histidinol-phosphatase (PHP family)
MTYFIKANYHTHCDFCDGKDSMDVMADAAFDRGFSALGFSSHAPVPVENDYCMTDDRVAPYFASARAVRSRYAGKMQVYVGLEIDYVDGVPLPPLETWRDLGMEYCLGSMHMIRDPASGMQHAVDYTEERFAFLLDTVFRGDSKALLTEYFRLYRVMLAALKPDIAGHIDLPKKLNKGNRFFDESASWYRSDLLGTLESVAASGAILEINTGGAIRGLIDHFYPSTDILARARDLRIPVTISTDAHRAASIDGFHAEALAEAARAGYAEVMVLYDGEWQAVHIPDE